MTERFREHLALQPWWREGLRVLVGYSGGADSTCLLHLLHEAGANVVAAHLHHGQRAEADEEQAKCEEFADSLGVPILTGRADVPTIARELKIGLEEAGRHARYEFFRQVRIQAEAEWIATAHTQDDSVETIILNLARGTGPRGLTGVPEQRERIVRPLLPFSRRETRSYCEERDFWFHNDPANEDLSFSRARIRHRVLPELEKINPEVRTAVARSAEIVAEESRFLDGAAAAYLEAAEQRPNGELAFLTEDVEVVLARDAMLAAPPVLLKRGIRLAMGVLGAAPDREQTLKIVEGLASTAKGSVTAEGGAVVAEWDKNKLHLRVVAPAQPFRYNLPVPGETESLEFGWRFVAYEGFDQSNSRSDRAVEARLDRNGIKGNLFFKTAEPADKIAPIGMEGTKRVADVLSSMGLTQAARKRLPIVCDMVGPLWVPNGPVDRRCHVGDDTSHVLHLRFEPWTARPEPEPS
ncbi:MAG: tRNA lysidine(34) synthetase TilS [Fimbriimonadaceae bacterium]